jgi:DNA-binding response OmpR family regulator
MSKRILLLSDQVAMGEQVARHIAAAGHECVPAYTTDEAGDHLRAQPRWARFA